MAVLAALAALDPESKKQIIGAGLGLLNSAPIIALGAALAVNLQWNLEHIAWDNRRRTFIRLSTVEAADVDHKDPDRTGLAPPLMSSATRLADNGLDVAASAARLAEASIHRQQTGGLIGTILTGIFGTG